MTTLTELFQFDERLSESADDFLYYIWMSALLCD